MVLKRFKEFKIKTVLFSKTDFEGTRLLRGLNKIALDLIVLAGFLWLIPENVINGYTGKIINIHPSLLPAFPGMNAQKQALEHGVKFSGCTVHFVDLGVDSGPIILQTVVPVYDKDDEKSLSKRILEQEHHLYPKAIKMIQEKKIRFSGRTVTSKII